MGSLAFSLSRLVRLIRPLVENWRRYGVMATVDLLLDRFVYRVLGFDVFKVLLLDVAELRLPPRRDSRFTFRFLSADEVRRFAADLSYEFTPGAAERAAAGQDLCFAALDGKRLAAYAWYALASSEMKHVYPKDVAYVSEGFTHPDYRGERLQGTIRGLALRQLADRGVGKLLSQVHWTNTASMRSCMRSGYVCLGRMCVMPLGSRTVVTTPRRARRLGVRFRSAAALPSRRSGNPPSIPDALDGQLAGDSSVLRHR